MHIRKLRHLCRRGTKELDLLTNAYLDLHYTDAPLEHKHCFHKLIALDDIALYDLLNSADTPQLDSTQQVAALIKQLTTHQG